MTLLVDVLTLLFKNRSKRFYFAALVLLYMIIGYYRRRKLDQRERKKFKNRKMVSEPLLTFSGAGFLGFYYQGVAAYIQDNFELDNARFAGISAGACTAAGLSAKMPVKASLLFGLRWFDLMSKEGVYFMTSKRLISIGTQVCNEFGIDDARVIEANARENYFFGVTDITTFPWRHCLVSQFRSREESFYAMSCSMRILPFFRNPGYFRGMCLLDGVFSAAFTILPDNDPAKIIRITPAATLFHADIQPDPYDPSSQFRWIDIFKKPSVDEICRQFDLGYRDAIRSRYTLIEKGLIPKETPECKLQEWTDFLRVNGNQILGGEAPQEEKIGALMSPSASVGSDDCEALRAEDFSKLTDLKDN